VRLLLLAGVVFVVAYTQSPLGFSNQNQYLLHAEALRPGSPLAEDWLAQTRDPTPLFTAWVAFTRFEIPSLAIFVSYAAVMLLYVVSLASILDSTIGLPTTRSGRTILLALILLAHAALWRWLSVQAFGVDYPWYFQCGVAGQYILGAGFQPSVFGVLLVASLAAFLKNRTILAITCAVGACALHFTYLLPTVLLGHGYLAAVHRASGRNAALRLAGLLTLGLLPVVAWNAVRFQPTDAATFAEAQRLLAEVRIPHHASVGRWFDPLAQLQIAWIGLTIVLVRRSPLALVLLGALVPAAILTAAAYVSGWHLLALLFPWRISTVLVPVATAILLGRFALVLERHASNASILLAGPVIAASLGFGAWQFHETIGYNMNEANERGLYEFVSRNKRPGDVYLIPTRIPALSDRRGNISTTFTPPPRPDNRSLIPVDLQRFRLATGAPIYIDFKAIPYADFEVLEWHRRVVQAQEWYKAAKWSESLPGLRRAGITHVVVTADNAIDDPHFDRVYDDANFRLYRLTP
jgi:hypothetical protein